MRTSIAISALALASASAGADVVSTNFEAGLDGWTSFQNGATQPEWIAPSASDSGHARLIDATNGWGYYRAPAAFTAQAAQYGGTVSFSLRHEFQGDSVAYKVRVGLTGGGLTLINEQTLPTTEWTSYSFGLDTGLGWRVFSNLSQNYTTGALLATQAQLETALLGLNGLFVAADYTPGFAPADLDRTFLDNVSLTVVPTPSATAILGLGGLLAARRRR